MVYQSSQAQELGHVATQGTWPKAEGEGRRHTAQGKRHRAEGLWKGGVLNRVAEFGNAVTCTSVGPH